MAQLLRKSLSFMSKVIYPKSLHKNLKNFEFSNSKNVNDIKDDANTIKETDIKLNWSLAKVLIIPQNTVFHNFTLKSKIEEDFIKMNESKIRSHGIIRICKNNVDYEDFSKIHTDIADLYNEKDVNYVEDGEICGLYVRVITNDKYYAHFARFLMKNVDPIEFKLNITIILCNDKDLTDLLFVNPKENLILTSIIDKRQWEEAVNLIYEDNEYF